MVSNNGDNFSRADSPNNFVFFLFSLFLSKTPTLFLALLFRPGHGMTSYLECMEKLQTAVKYFTETNPGSPEVSQVVRHFSWCCDRLCSVVHCYPNLHDNFSLIMQKSQC